MIWTYISDVCTYLVFIYSSFFLQLNEDIKIYDLRFTLKFIKLFFWKNLFLCCFNDLDYFFLD